MVYKINLIVDNNIVEIYVFGGDLENFREVEELIKNIKTINSETNDLSNIFDRNEIEDIKENDIRVLLINDILNKDDSIALIKIKILSALSNSKNDYYQLRIEDLYLFTSKKLKITSNELYENIENYGFESSHSFFPFVINIDKIRATEIKVYMPFEYQENIEILKKTDITNHIDLKHIDIFDRKIKINIPLGMISSTFRYDMIYNPYLTYYNYGEINMNYQSVTLSEDKIVNVNSNFMGDIDENYINLVIYQDIEKVIKSNNDTPSSVILNLIVRLYFPYLYNKPKNLSIKYEKIGKYNNLVNEILKYPGTFKNGGITYISGTLENKNIKYLSLNLVFKILKSTLEYPMIKLKEHALKSKKNDQKVKSQENLYRIYAPNLNKYNDKIPYMSIADINSKSRILTKLKSIGILVNTEIYEKDIIDQFIINIFEDGSISYDIHYEKLTNIELVDIHIQEKMNPIIKKLMNVFESSGYIFTYFKSITKTIINNITYNMKIPADSVNCKLIEINPMFNSIFLMFSESPTHLRLILKRFENNDIDDIYTQILFYLLSKNNRKEIKNLIKYHYSKEKFEKMLKLKQNADIVNLDNIANIIVDITCKNKCLNVCIKNIKYLFQIDILKKYIHCLLNKIPKTEIIFDNYDLSLKKIHTKTIIIEPLSQLGGTIDYPNLIETIGPSLENRTLNNPNYFTERIKNNTKNIIVKVGDSKKIYTKFCQSNTDKIPLILTNDQMKELYNTHEEFFKDSADILTYKEEGEENKYFMCPDYACLLNDMPLTQEQVDNGVCGGLISKINKKKQITKNNYVYKFDKPGKRYPNIGPNEKKIYPCCYDKRRKGTSSDPLRFNPAYSYFKKSDLDDVVEEVKEVKEEVKEVVKYDNMLDTKKKFIIKSPAILEKDRIGIIQQPLQTFFLQPISKCFLKKPEKLELKENCKVLLRHGVEKNEYNSFIAVMADILYYTSSHIPTIIEMKHIIAESLDIDQYILYKNGNLYINFLYGYENQKEEELLERIKNYKTSEIYLKIDKKNKYELLYLKKLVYSFETFKEYLLKPDNDYIIDYTYLWDIFSTKNETLFKEGCNIIIFDITDLNVDNNTLDLICPSDYYSDSKYDISKNSIFIIKNENFYEPIYLYKLDKLNDKNDYIVKKTFNVNDDTLSESIKNVLTNIIVKIYNSECNKTSRTKIYPYVEPITMRDLIEEIRKLESKLIIYLKECKQIINLNNKVIGLFIVFTKEEKEMSDYDDTSVFRILLPCYPSKINKDLESMFITSIDDSMRLWQDYFETIETLVYLYENSNKKIPCAPLCHIEKNNNIIGLLTLTNQFIKFEQVLSINNKNILKEYPIISDNNYLLDEYTVEELPDFDKDNIKNNIDVNEKDSIQLETYMYNLFRNEIRKLLNKQSQLETNISIQEIISSNKLEYKEKIKNIYAILNGLTRNKIIFISDIVKYYEDIDLILNNKSEFYKDNNLVISKKNMITGDNNKIIYHIKLADELLRFRDNREFILNLTEVHNFINVDMKLDNEILIGNNAIREKFFSKMDLIPVRKNFVLTDIDSAVNI